MITLKVNKELVSKIILENGETLEFPLEGNKIKIFAKSDTDEDALVLIPEDEYYGSKNKVTGSYINTGGGDFQCGDNIIS